MNSADKCLMLMLAKSARTTTVVHFINRSIYIIREPKGGIKFKEIKHRRNKK